MPGPGPAVPADWIVREGSRLIRGVRSPADGRGMLALWTKKTPGLSGWVLAGAERRRGRLRAPVGNQITSGTSGGADENLLLGACDGTRRDGPFDRAPPAWPVCGSGLRRPQTGNAKGAYRGVWPRTTGQGPKLANLLFNLRAAGGRATAGPALAVLATAGYTPVMRDGPKPSSSTASGAFRRPARGAVGANSVGSPNRTRRAAAAATIYLPKVAEIKPGNSRFAGPGASWEASGVERPKLDLELDRGLRCGGCGASGGLRGLSRGFPSLP